MEESAKRRERLQAMRSEASRPAAPSPLSDLSPASAVPPPALPLPQFADPPVLDSPLPSVPRFDFYTDPTSAFSATKRMRGDATAGCRPSFPYRPPPPLPPSFPTGTRSNYVDSSRPSVHQFQPPDSGFYSTPSRFPHNSPWRSPMQVPTPFPGHQRSPAGGPGSWNRPVGSPRQGFPPYSPSDGLTSPHTGRGQNPMGHAGSSSPHSISGRGRGQQFSGGRGRRGRSFNNKASAQSDIGSYFCPSMLQDPWSDMLPVVGNILEPRAGPGYWLPESLAERESLARKKSKVSETESSNRLNSKSSLAEFLASSLDEAINDED